MSTNKVEWAEDEGGNPGDREDGVSWKCRKGLGPWLTAVTRRGDQSKELLGQGCYCRNSLDMRTHGNGSESQTWVTFVIIFSHAASRCGIVLVTWCLIRSRSVPPLSRTGTYALSPSSIFEMPKAYKESQSGKKSCPICQGSFRPQNYGPHFRKCERKKKVDEGRRAYEKELSKRRVMAPFSGAHFPVVSLPNRYLTPFFLVSEPLEVESAGIRDHVDAPHTPHSQAPREMELEGEEHIPISIGWTLSTFSSLSAFCSPTSSYGR